MGLITRKTATISLDYFCHLSRFEYLFKIITSEQIYKEKIIRHFPNFLVNNFCLPQSVRSAEVRSPIVLERKYILPVSNVQLKYHLHLEAFLTHDPVTCFLLCISLTTVTCSLLCVSLTMAFTNRIYRLWLTYLIPLSWIIKSLRVETIINLLCS